MVGVISINIYVSQAVITLKKLTAVNILNITIIGFTCPNELWNGFIERAKAIVNLFKQPLSTYYVVVAMPGAIAYAS